MNASDNSLFLIRSMLIDEVRRLQAILDSNDEEITSLSGIEPLEAHAEAGERPTEFSVPDTIAERVDRVMREARLKVREYLAKESANLKPLDLNQVYGTRPAPAANTEGKGLRLAAWHVVDVWKITALAPRCAMANEAIQNLDAALRASPAIPEGLREADVEWVVNDNSELGVKIGNRFFFLYKGDSLVYKDGKHDDGSPMLWRLVGKREFGECCHPVHLTRYPEKYIEGEGWEPIDASPSAQSEGVRE